MRHSLCIVAFGALLSFSTVHAQQPGTSWPPPGVLQVSDVDTPPRAIKTQRAAYPADAMRAEIQGLVVLSCVVNPDGTVGQVRVTRSLDELHGLDAAAVAAAKQWQYSPAMKDGKAVPVVVSVEMSFTLGKTESSYFYWPGGFSGPTSSAGAWKTLDLDSSETRLHVEYPESWTVRRDPAPQDIVTLQSANSAAAMTIERITASSSSYSRPFPSDQVKAIADRMTPGSRAFGQVSAGGRVWVWTESPVHDGTVTWRFQTAADDAGVSVRMTANVAQAELTAELGAMLRRMTIKSKLQ